MRFTIKAKLAVTFGLLILALVGIVALSISRLGTLNQSITELIEGPAALEAAVGSPGRLTSMARSYRSPPIEPRSVNDAHRVL